MSDKQFKENDFLKNYSVRHHYIPKFLSSGFTNADGLLFIYDKNKDRILSTPKPPKSIFFEHERNTLEVTSESKSSFIEDFLYSDIDNRASKVIQYYRTAEMAKIDFSTDDSATFLFFLICLFWRIPKTDYAASDLIERAEISATGIDPEILRRDPTFQKLSRAGLFKHHIDEMLRDRKVRNKYLNIYNWGQPVFVIGDYPILFKKQPKKFSEFDDTDFLIAISSNRIFSSTLEPLQKFGFQNSLRYNACVIDQSIRYIAAGDLKVLEQSVWFYKRLMEKGLIYSLSEVTFKA